MNRTALLLVALGLGGTLLVSTGAVPLVNGPTDDIGEDVELVPSDGPNGRYAHLDSDDELVVDIAAAADAEGVNQDSVTTFDDVFRIRYNGSRYAKVWLSHESESVTFYARGDPIESRESSVVLDSKESVPVGVRVDTTGRIGDGLIDDITVHASVADPEDVERTEQESSGETTDTTFSLDVSEPDNGLTVTVTEPTTDERAVTIQNLSPDSTVDIDLGALEIVDDAITLDSIRFESTTTGDANFTFSQQTAQSSPVEPIGDETDIDALGYFTLHHTIPDSAVENVSLQFSARWSYLDANGIDSKDVRLLRYGTDGWTILKSDRLVGTAERARFTVDSPGLSTFAVGVRTSRFVTADARVSPRTIQVGETATVTADVANHGAVAGQTTVTLTRNGSAVQNRTVALDAGENTTVRFDVAPPTPGTHAFAVDGTVTRTLTVESQPATPTPTAPADDDVATGQPPNETVAVSGEAAGFDIVALGGIVAIVAVVAVVGALRRRRGP
jgi:PGF-pre-PGF domain-containing protein